jgi:hypothetical protein
MKTVANRNVRDAGYSVAHAAVSPRPPISLSRSVARTEDYTYAAKVWDLFHRFKDHFRSPRAEP